MFAQIDPDGSRLTDLARRANMSPQAMGELVDELEEMKYVVRRPDPTDLLGERGHRQLRSLHTTVLDDDGA